VQSPSQRLSRQLFSFEHALRDQWSSESPATPKQLQEYENAWQDCFQHKFLGATKTEMMRVIAHSSCVVVSDFHPLKRSRQDFSTIVKHMDGEQQVIVVLELLDSSVTLKRGQRVSENVLLQNGSSLAENYPLMFDEHQHAKYEIVGAWVDGGAHKRDRHCSEVIKRLNSDNQHAKLALHFGDWHLADNHLPQQIKKVGISATVIHLSPQPLWDRLSKRDFDKVIKFGANKWAWMSTPPLAHAAAFLLDFSVFHEDDYTEELAYLIEVASSKLAISFNFKRPESAYEVMMGDDWYSFWSSLDEHHQQQFDCQPKTVVFHPRLPLIWIPSAVDANMIIQAAAHLIYCEHFMIAGDFCDSFRAASLRHLCNISLNPFFELKSEDTCNEYQWIERSAFEHAKWLNAHHCGPSAQLFERFKHPQLWDYELQLLRDTIEVA
jgi:hypothetical protein